MPMPGKELFMNMYIYTPIYIFEKLFTKAKTLNLALALQAHFLEWRLTRFGKELFNYFALFSYINKNVPCM